MTIRTFRVIPSPTAGLITFPSGKQVTSSTAYIDLETADANYAVNAGCHRLAEVGTTATRTALGAYEADTNLRNTGYHFYDTDLSMLLTWHQQRRVWLDISGIER